MKSAHSLGRVITTDPSSESFVFILNLNNLDRFFEFCF